MGWLPQMISSFYSSTTLNPIVSSPHLPIPNITTVNYLRMKANFSISFSVTTTKCNVLGHLHYQYTVETPFRKSYFFPLLNLYSFNICSYSWTLILSLIFYFFWSIQNALSTQHNYQDWDYMSVRLSGNSMKTLAKEHKNNT